MGIDVNWNTDTNIYFPRPFGKKSDNLYPYGP